MTETNTTTTVTTEQPNLTPATEAVKSEDTTTSTTVEKTEEAPKVEEPKDEKKEKTAKQFAELAKRERRLVEQERRLKDSTTKVSQYEKSLQKAKENPMEFLQEVSGYDFETVLNKYLASLGQDPKKPEEVKLQRLEERLAAYEKAEQEKQAQAQEHQNKQAWNQHINAVSQYVEQNKDQYEVILSHPERATSLYQEMVNQTIQMAGRALSDEEVIALINRTEELMTEEYKPLLEKLNKTKKFSSPAPKAEPEKIVTETLKPKTLTNNLSTSPTSTNNNTKLSREERDRLKLEEIRRKYDSR